MRVVKLKRLMVNRNIPDLLRPSQQSSGIFSNASLDLPFAERKVLTDAISGKNLITFTRTSSGTYVGSDGVLKTATTNLLLRSEEFDNASWTKNALQAFGSGSVANAIAAPNGTLTADYLAENTSLAEHFAEQFFTAFAGLTYTFSVYVKAGPNKTNVNLRFSTTAWGGAVSNQIRFNLINGAITVVSGTGTGAATQLNDGWWRFSITATSTANGSPSARVHLIENNGTNNNYTGDGTSGIYLWGAQLEQSSTVGEYIPTTSTINSAPRFDHNPTTGESLGLLVEEQRTNLALWSQVIRLTEWSSQQATTQTINQAAAPDGTNTASTLIENSQTANRFIGQTMAVTNAAYTWSVFAKTKERRRILLRENSVSGAAAAFDVTTGTVIGTESGATATITAYSNGWFKCSMTYTPSASSSRLHVIYLLPDSGTSFATSSYTGDNSSGIYLWGAQLEAGAFPTSYIPTTTATATRSADVASITGTNFSSWYSQSEGTVFADVNSAPVNNIAQLTFDISEGAGNERMFQRRNTSGIVATAVLDNGVTQADIGSVVIGASARYRSGYAYKLNDLEIVVNGGGSATDTSATMPTPDRLHIGQNYASGQICNGTLRRLTFWPSRLPSSTLQQITA